MDTALKVLILEDSLQDKELITEQLYEAGFQLEITHAVNEEMFSEAIGKCRYDIIISDFKLPGFDAFGALEICQKKCPEIPFICVSGSIGEETAIQLLRKGAVDYVLKDRPDRLPHAILRALDEVKEKAALVKTEKELLESEARFRQVAEAAQEWIWEVDANGLFTYASPVVKNLLGYNNSEIVGKKHFYDFFIPSKKEELKKAAFDVFSRKESFRNFENPNINKDGNIVILTTSGSPVTDENGILKGYRGVDADITERTRIFEELTAAKKKAEESDRLKTAFLNNISHEIRTPLNAIVGFSTLLAEPDLTDQTRSSYIDTVTQSSDKLLAIISDIIDISNIEAGIVKLSEEKIRINDVFDKLGKVFVPLATGRGLELRFVKNLADDEAVIVSDNHKLYQILYNLLNNSFKFTSAGSVEAGYSIKENFIEFYVSDTGIGIPENQISRIFDRFYQVDHTISRTFEGTGLGLSISKAFVEYMGGRMWVESKHGNGSVFFFTLPFRKQLTEAISLNESNQHKNTRNYNIVIVEDEEFNARLILSYLRQPHFKVKRFANGEEAFNYCLSEKNIDLVIMDLHLPGSGGLEVTEKLKKSFPDIKVIAQTAYALPGDKEESLAAGCDDFITKPFRKDFFISRVMELLSK